MIRRTPRSTRTDTPFPYTTLFRSEAAAQVEAVGDELEVAQDLGLLGVARRPVPLVEQDLGERVAVVEALRVAPGSGIAVPVPRAARAAPRFDADDVEAERLDRKSVV